MTFVVAIHMPDGYRPMNPADLARISWGSLVMLLDTHTGHTITGSVKSESSSHFVVLLRGGAEITIDRQSAQSPDEQFVALTRAFATEEAEDQNSALLVALRASNEIAKLKGRIRVAEQTIARMADQLQARPTQEQYDAIHAELNHLRDDIRALQLKRAS